MLTPICQNIIQLSHIIRTANFQKFRTLLKMTTLFIMLEATLNLQQPHPLVLRSCFSQSTTFGVTSRKIHGY